MNAESRRPRVRGAAVLLTLAAILLVLVFLWQHGRTTAEHQASEEEAPADTGSIDRVIDGDTVDVLVDGKLQRVRLLNIDTPETRDPIECLGAEATEFTRDLLPSGSEVSLSYDVERTDQYGRTLATVTTRSGIEVNEALVEAGLAVAIVVGKNDRNYDRMLAAEARAEQGRVGLFAPASCVGR